MKTMMRRLTMVGTNINPTMWCGVVRKIPLCENGATDYAGHGEIHLDLTPDAGAAIERDPATVCYPAVTWNCGTWFIQYDRQDDASLASLPVAHWHWCWAWTPLLPHSWRGWKQLRYRFISTIDQTIATELSVDYSQGWGTPHRVISDHIRTVAWAISVNVLHQTMAVGMCWRLFVVRCVLPLGAGKTIHFYRLIPVVWRIGRALCRYWSTQDYAELVKAEEQQFLRTVSSD